MYEENSRLEQRSLNHEGPLPRSEWNAVSFMYKGYEISIAGKHKQEIMGYLEDVKNAREEKELWEY